MEILPNLPTNIKILRILTYLHIIINVAWSCPVLYCLQASVGTSCLLRPHSLSGWTVWGSNPSTGPETHPISCTSGWGGGGGARQSGHGDDHSHPSSAMVKERVQLYLNAPCAYVACYMVNFTFLEDTVLLMLPCSAAAWTLTEQHNPAQTHCLNFCTCFTKDVNSISAEKDKIMNWTVFCWNNEILGIIF
jgi:hypothetical protein